MKHPELWRPSKFVLRKGRLYVSSDPRQVAVSSRVGAALVARFYSDCLPVCARGRLLDLGCGKLPLFAAYKPYVEEVICVDWAASFHDNPHLDHIADLNSPLSLPDNSFDTVILSDVLEHIREPAQLLSEVARVLRVGGTLILNVPFYYMLHEEPYDYYRYTKYALEYLVVRSGLSVVRLEARGGIPEIMGDLSAKLLHRIPWFGKPLAALSQAITRLLVAIPPGRQLSHKTSRRFPMCYCLVASKIG